MSRKLNINKVIIIVSVFLICLCGVGYLIFVNLKPKSNTNVKLTDDYISNSTYIIENCRRDIGTNQQLIGTLGNVSYCLNFPLFEQNQINKQIASELNEKIMVYDVKSIDKNLVNDRFELYSNYQTFKNGEDGISIQFQFLEKNLTKQSSSEFLQTYIFKKGKLVDKENLFKSSKIKDITDKIKSNIMSIYGKNIDKSLNNADIVKNCVETDESIIFFFNRSQILLPGKFKPISIELSKSEIENCLNSSKKAYQNSAAPTIALTFDDGPDAQYTEQLLKILEQNDAKATFFVVGSNVERHPEIVKKTLRQGHEIANHTYSHANLTKLNVDEINDQVNRTNKLIKEATDGYQPKLVRPPGGAVNAKVIQTIEEPLILWTIDTNDWKTHNARQTINTVLTGVTDGAIVLMHDIHKETIDAAKTLIPKLVEKGYNLVTVSELFENQDIELHGHKIYRNAKKTDEKHAA